MSLELWKRGSINMTERKQKAIENLTQWSVGAVLGTLCVLSFMLAQYIFHGVYWTF